MVSRVFGHSGAVFCGRMDARVLRECLRYVECVCIEIDDRTDVESFPRAIRVEA